MIFTEQWCIEPIRPYLTRRHTPPGMQQFANVSLAPETIEAAFAAANRPYDGEPHPRLKAILQQERPMQHTPEWFARRRSLLTASNIASFLGMNRYCSKRMFLRRAWDELHNAHAISPSRSMPACAWGSKHEAEAAALYSFVTGNKCWAADVGLVVHPEMHFLGASPDRVLCDRPVLIEIKAPFKRVIEPEVIPPVYVPQVQSQMEVCDMEECHFVQFTPATLCTPGILSVLLVRRDRAWWRKYEPLIETYEVELKRQADEDQEHPPVRRQRKRKRVENDDDTTAARPVSATETTPTTTTTNQTPPPPSKPAEDSMSSSPGVYNIYVDQRIGVAAGFRDLLKLTETPTDQTASTSPEQ